MLEHDITLRSGTAGSYLKEVIVGCVDVDDFDKY